MEFYAEFIYDFPAKDTTEVVCGPGSGLGGLIGLCILSVHGVGIVNKFPRGDIKSVVRQMFLQFMQNLLF
jgi:hypothetical protein